LTGDWQEPHQVRKVPTGDITMVRNRKSGSPLLEKMVLLC
jgi:hypothetical protein